MGELGNKIDIEPFRITGYMIEGERYQINNQKGKYFYHLFVYDLEVSKSKEIGIQGITASNLSEVKKIL
ncbi:hypothetical protein LCGC14_0603450, partial [marine sediment metagenome]